MLSPERFDVLQQNWLRLMARYGVAAPDAYPPFDLLVAAYGARDRHYHTLEHLFEMFFIAGRLALFCQDPPAVQLAIWFHDAVYDPRARDNEARSADLAVLLLGPIGVPAGVLDRVTRMIRFTSHAGEPTPPGDRDTAALLDADLAILCASEDRYRQYAADIRKEYAWVPEFEYCKGRTAVLEKFLKRPRIYFHELMFQEGESRARENLLAEIARLNAAASE